MPKQKMLKFADAKKLREKDLKQYLKPYKVSKDDLEEILGILTNVHLEFYRCLLDSLVLQDILKEKKIEISIDKYGEMIKDKAKKIPYEKKGKK